MPTWPALYYVSPRGRDDDDGSADAPFATLRRARDAVRLLDKSRTGPIEIRVLPGTYRLSRALRLEAQDSGSQLSPICYKAERAGEAVISGTRVLSLDWRAYRGGILQAEVPEEIAIDTLILDGQVLRMARYPKFDPEGGILNGTSADALSPERVSRWANPAGAWIHALHSHQWGGYHVPIMGKDEHGELILGEDRGNNRRMGLHRRFRFVENVFEELSAPGEWYFDVSRRMLYLMPPEGADPARCLVETTCLANLVELFASEREPVHNIGIEGFVFRYSDRTFALTSEPLLRSDWMIHRGGACMLEGTEDCALTRCSFDRLGGNALMVSGYNRRFRAESCSFADSGASDIVFAGRPEAVRSPLFEYGQTLEPGELDLLPGPRNESYPADCLVRDCLMTRCGRTEKQSAGVEIAISRRITVSRCSIYDLPRAGINIGDGCFGGHVIERCDVFDTVKETGDHGAFNSWGRDRFWVPEIAQIDRRVGAFPELPFLDALEPVAIRNNRFQCEHGWDIDLDDGSSNYHIHDNLCLGGGIKNREGYRRIVENNVMVNNGFHPHVWQRDSGDVFRRNIVFEAYADIGMPEKWGSEFADNFLHSPGYAGKADVPAAELRAKSGGDERSLKGDARFIDPAVGDYRVAEGSGALALGFRNFAMDDFGVASSELKAKARRPEMPAAIGRGFPGSEARSVFEFQWQGAYVKNVTSLGEISATGLPGADGIFVLGILEGSQAAKAGLRTRDVIQGLDGSTLNSIDDLASLCRSIAVPSALRLSIWRNQRTDSCELAAEGDILPERVLVRLQRD